MYLRFQRMIRDTKATSIDDATILNWRAMLDDEHEWYLGALRGFLISWHDYGYYGVPADVVRLLEGLTLSGNSKGVAVANRCPYSGAFTPNEVLALNQELIRLFRDDEIPLAGYSYISVLQATARRPIQIRQLKACDVIRDYNSESQATNFYLNIPRAKQRGGGFRVEFKKLSITEDLYLTLKNLVEAETQKLEALFDVELSPQQLKLVPLFIDWKMTDDFKQQGMDMSLDLLRADVLHLSEVQLRERYMHNFKVKQVAISERTGDVIHVTARRFRHTRATNLGRKGLGAHIIAEALDQSDTQNVKVYTENTAETVAYIDKAVGKQLAPFANAFMGKIIMKAADGERGDDPTAHIPDVDNEVVGACGTNDFCVKGYEACYLCHKFRPLADAPHEKFLNMLYAEKEKRLKETKSEEYASTKDRLILAVEWVVQKCAEMNAQKEGK
ncbi:site-specific integrase [Vibrio sp. F13]|nr:integrase [Vibrio sp. 10N.261.54.C3]TKF43876.1 site-specific integrase [Vibrio sp. F13]TKF62469.1 site-specific integrase [Vibrio sp. F13]